MSAANPATPRNPRFGRTCLAVSFVLAAGAALLPLDALAQVAGVPEGGEALAERVRAVGDGTVGFEFAARPDICTCTGCEDGGDTCNTCWHREDGNREWSGSCANGPALVSVTSRGGRVVSVNSYVGGAWIEGALTDLGPVAPAVAADFLLQLAERSGSANQDAAEDAIFAATLAAGVTTWPRLLALARDRAIDEDTRQAAVFWLGQAAGDAVARELEAFVGEEPDDLEVREHAVFAISELPQEKAVPALIRIATTNPHLQLRRAALFWLGESEDPRALELFEELLAGE